LLESLLVLALTAIVLSWAVPQYQSHLRRGQRQAAKLSLMQTAQWLERAAASQGSYPTVQQIPAALLKVPGDAYLIQAQTEPSNNTFALKALPQSSQMQDACGVLTLNHLGEQGVQGASLNAIECWSR
jgi:type IV pilus assembly protein PilE